MPEGGAPGCGDGEQGESAPTGGFFGEWEIVTGTEVAAGTPRLQVQGLRAQVTRGRFCGQNPGCVSRGGDNRRLGAEVEPGPGGGRESEVFQGESSAQALGPEPDRAGSLIPAYHLACREGQMSRVQQGEPCALADWMRAGACSRVLP